MEKFILNYYRSSTFNVCEHQELPMMSGPPHELHIDQNVKPTAIHNPMPIPLHWKEEVKRQFDMDERLGVIEKVPVGELVTWLSWLVVASKKNRKLRWTVDLQKLNATALRETHHTPSPFNQAMSIPNDKLKTTFDAWNGYHSVPIRKSDRDYNSFLTEWGRYHYRVAPQGYATSGDRYTQRRHRKQNMVHRRHGAMGR